MGNECAGSAVDNSNSGCGVSGSLATLDNGGVSQTITLSEDTNMGTPEIQRGFTSTMSTDIWFWHGEDKVTMTQTLTDSSGDVNTQIRIVEDSHNNYQTYTDSITIGSNTSTDYTIKAQLDIDDSANCSSHCGPDIDNTELSITYNTSDGNDFDFEEDIPDFEEEFTFEDDFTFEEDDYFSWEEDFTFEDDFSMEEDYTVGDWEEMEFDEEMYFEEEFVEMEMPEEMEMTMTPEEEFEEMYFEEEFDESAFMDMPEEEFEDMSGEMEMEEEEFEEMEVVEEEETIDMKEETEEDVVEMEGEEEEMEVAENDDTMEEPKEDEESSEGNEEAVEEEPESEESSPKAVEDEEESITETDVADEGGITTKNIEVSKEIKIKDVNVGEIKVSVDPRDIFKEVVSLDSYSNKDFYRDDGLQYDVNDDFFDQLSMIEYNKEIYKGVTLVLYIQGDPVEIYKQELEELAIQKAGIMIELKLLRGE
jgi:hypothetical protein